MELTTKDVAQLWGCTIQSVNSARRKAEKEFGKEFGKASPSDRRVRIFQEDEVLQMESYAPKRGAKVAEIEYEAFDDEKEAVVVNGGGYRGIEGLTVVHRPPAIELHQSDVLADRRYAQSVAGNAIQGMNGLLNQYAAARIVGAFQRIDATVEQLEAAALNNAMGKLNEAAGTPQAE